MTDGDSAKLARQTTVAAAALVVGVALVAVAVWTRRPRLEPIEVSQQTTYIITPTRADGWVDYPEAVDWMRRASLDAGGANAAVTLVRALGRDVLPIGVDRAALLVRLGIDVAGADASAMPALKDVKPMSGRPPREPSPAAIEWLQARCPADAQGSASFGKIMGWLTEVDAAVKDLRTAAQAASLYVPVPRGAAATGNFDRVNPIRLADAAAALACHAAMKLLGGLAPASWSDAEALWRLGQLVARSATAGEYAVAEVFWKAALIATVDLAASPATSPELLSTMQAGLGAQARLSARDRDVDVSSPRGAGGERNAAGARAREGPRAGRRPAGAHRHRREAGSDQPGVRRDRRRAANARSRATDRPRRTGRAHDGGAGRRHRPRHARRRDPGRLVPAARVARGRAGPAAARRWQAARVAGRAGQPAQGSRQRRRLHLHGRRRALSAVRRRGRRPRRPRRARARRRRGRA